ncbi:hypothetical protein C4559_04030 [Candidatus Microgenomates bacterium]|nr:MAG: hypothetical protein C4559_04030 [Candidatus Microgenomates bacterium]
MKKYKFAKAKKRRDKRGFLVDFLKLDEVGEGEKTLGQIYFVTFDKKGSVRGNHYHKTKKEWFVAVEGKLKVILEDISTKEKVEFILKGSSDIYERVYIEENIAHSFISLTKKAKMINYCNRPFHESDPDTFIYKLI